MNYRENQTLEIISEQMVPDSYQLGLLKCFLLLLIHIFGSMLK